jgi:hypothetical protein
MSYRLGGTYGGPRPNGHIEIVWNSTGQSFGW